MSGFYKQIIRYQEFAQGWEEVYYVYADTPVLAATLSIPQMDVLLRLRSEATELVSIEATDEVNPRLGYLNQVNRSLPAASGSGRNDVDVTAVAARCQFRTSIGAKRFVWLRGLPDAFVTRDPNTGASIPAASMAGALIAYFQMLCGPTSLGAPYPAFIKRYQPVNVGGIETAVTGMVVNPTNPLQTDVTLAAAIDPAYTRVRFLGNSAGFLPGLKGVFRIVNRNLNVITIPYKLRTVTTGGFPPNLRAVTVAYQYLQFTGGQFASFSTRDTGRPTGTQRGRSRAATRRQ